MRREATPGLFYLRSLPRVQDHRTATLLGVQNVPTAASSSVSPAPAAPTSANVTVFAVTDVTFPTTDWQKLPSSPELCAHVMVQTIVQLPRVQDHRAATLPDVQDVPTASSSSVSPAPAAPTSADVTVSAVTDVTFPTTDWNKTPVVPWAVCFRDGTDHNSVLSGFCSRWWHADPKFQGIGGHGRQVVPHLQVWIVQKLKSLVWTIMSSSEQGASQRCGRVALTSWGWQWISWRRRTSQLLSSCLQSVCLALQERHRLHPANTSLHSCMLSRRWPSSDASCL